MQDISAVFLAISVGTILCYVITYTFVSLKFYVETKVSIALEKDIGTKKFSLFKFKVYDFQSSLKK